MFGKVEAGREQLRGELPASDRGLPHSILRERVCEMPTLIEETE
jgi:hypothetical protein